MGDVLSFLDNGGAPDEEAVFTDLFESPIDVCDNCASELVGYFKPPTDGAYTFVIASDDGGALYFGPTDDEVEVICSVPGWTESRQYGKYPVQTSSQQQLQADGYYAMRALANENDGADHLSVGVTLPDGTQLWPIPASYFVTAIPSPSVIACTRCTGPTMAECTSATCADGCIPGSYSLGSCISCSEVFEAFPSVESCSMCSGPAPADCSSAVCAVGYHSYANGACCLDVAEQRVGSECACSVGYVPAQGCVVAQPCPAGSEREANHDNTDTSCVECAVGEWSSAGGMCALCPAGKVPNQARSACEDCQPGSQAAPDQSGCTACPAGAVRSTELACFQCAVGQIQNAAQSACERCMAGKAPAADQLSCQSCVGTTVSTSGFECQACDAPNVVDSAHQLCTSCAPGEEPNDDRTACVACVGTTYSPFGALCVECAAPNIVNEVQTSCTACPAGRGPHSDATQCIECADGWYSTFGVCTECFAPNVVSSDKTGCVLPSRCTAGTECVNENGCDTQADCSQCPVGSVSASGAPCQRCSETGKVANNAQTFCETCSSGRAPSDDRSTCEACSGTNFSAFGMECVDCPAPNVVNSGRTTCTPCTAGTGPSSDRTECISCTGTAYSTIGQCQPCDAPFVVDSTHRTCTSCGPGEEPNFDRTACIACIGTTYSGFGTLCLDCPSPSIVNNARSTCLACSAGKGPNESRTACSTCTGATFSTTGQCTQCPSPNVVSSERTSCSRCTAGYQPNVDRDGCVVCTGNSAGAFGECDACPAGKIANAEKTTCNDLNVIAQNDNTLTDVGAVIEVISNGTNVLPKTSMQLSVAESVLEPGSAQTAVFDAFRSTIAQVLRPYVTANEIRITGITRVTGLGRRRTQTGIGDIAAIITFVIVSTSAPEGLQTLVEQFGDPTSILYANENTGGFQVDPDTAPYFSFVCPEGTKRSSGEPVCVPCEGNNEIPTDGQDACQPCPGGTTNGLAETPKLDGSQCVCKVGSYSTTSPAQLIPVASLPVVLCFDIGYRPQVVNSVRKTDEVLQCYDCPYCIECGTANKSRSVTLKHGYQFAEKGENLPILATRNAFRCPIADACPEQILEPVYANGELRLIAARCKHGHTGTLCAKCFPGNGTHLGFKKGPKGICEECTVQATWLNPLLMVPMALVLLYVGFRRFVTHKREQREKTKGAAKRLFRDFDVDRSMSITSAELKAGTSPAVSSTALP